MKKFHFLKPKLVKPKFFLTTPLALLSLELYSGALLGYFTAKFLSGRLRSLIFDIGNYRLHLHHWLYSLAILISAIWYQFLPFPQFSFGFLGGVVFQGISSYPDWHRVLVRRK
jgi:hypothetical protein